MSEQLTRNYLIDVVNGRTTSKEQERQFVSTGGKLSEVKTGSQVLVDAIIEERTHQYASVQETARLLLDLMSQSKWTKNSTRISSSRHGASKTVIYASMLSGQNLHALSVRLPNRRKLRRENLWVLI